MMVESTLGKWWCSGACLFELNHKPTPPTPPALLRPLVGIRNIVLSTDHAASKKGIGVFELMNRIYKEVNMKMSQNNVCCLHLKYFDAAAGSI